jgi:mannose-6-phosphate isomerase-like protein (cupin superfamily)
MATLTFFDSDSSEWLSAEATAPENMRARMSEGELASEARFPHPGDEHRLQMLEARIPPNTQLAPHAHEADEIIYVVQGEMHFGSRVLGPGSSVYIRGMTLYQFASGPDGLHFVNFRGYRDMTYFPKEEFLARRGTPEVHVDA